MPSSEILLITILLLLFQPEIFNAETIDITIDQQYKDSNVNCSGNEACTIICDTYDGCYNANINCPSSTHSCDITCGGGSYTCYSAQFYCPSNAQCNIICSGRHACQYAAFSWPTNGLYSLICSGVNSCNGITIDAPYPNQNFTFECSGRYSCGAVTINCPTNAYCNIICSNQISCAYAQINWPINNEYGSLQCRADRSCDETNFPKPKATEPYVLNCDDSDVFCEGSEIHCPINADCTIDCTTGSCADVTIHCPTNSSSLCNVQCNGDCENIQIYFENAYYDNVIFVDYADTAIPTFYPNSSTQSMSIDCSSTTCSNRMINCPINGNCDITCMDSILCNGLEVYWSDNGGYSNLTCIDANTCLSITSVISCDYKLYCGPCTDIIGAFPSTCKLSCDWCYNMVMECSRNTPCIVECSDCELVTINAKSATNLTVTCLDDYRSCQNITIICGTGDCIVNCNDYSEECIGTTTDITLSASFSCNGYCDNIYNGLITSEPTITTNIPSTIPTRIPSHVTTNPTLKPTGIPSDVTTMETAYSPTNKVIVIIDDSNNTSWIAYICIGGAICCIINIVLIIIIVNCNRTKKKKGFKSAIPSPDPVQTDAQMTHASVPSFDSIHLDDFKDKMKMIINENNVIPIINENEIEQLNSVDDDLQNVYKNANHNGSSQYAIENDLLEENDDDRQLDDMYIEHNDQTAFGNNTYIHVKNIKQGEQEYFSDSIEEGTAYID